MSRIEQSCTIMSFFGNQFRTGSVLVLEPVPKLGPVLGTVPSQLIFFMAKHVKSAAVFCDSHFLINLCCCLGCLLFGRWAGLMEHKQEKTLIQYSASARKLDKSLKLHPNSLIRNTGLNHKALPRFGEF